MALRDAALAPPGTDDRRTEQIMTMPGLTIIAVPLSPGDGQVLDEAFRGGACPAALTVKGPQTPSIGLAHALIGLCVRSCPTLETTTGRAESAFRAPCPSVTSRRGVDGRPLAGSRQRLPTRGRAAVKLRKLRDQADTPEAQRDRPGR